MPQAFPHPSGGVVIGHHIRSFHGDPAYETEYSGFLRIGPNGDSLQHVLLRRYTRSSAFGFAPHDTVGAPGGSYYHYFFQDSVGYNVRDQLQLNGWRWVFHRRDTSLAIIDSFVINFHQAPWLIRSINQLGYSQLYAGPGGDVIGIREVVPSPSNPSVRGNVVAYRINPSRGTVLWAREYYVSLYNGISNVQPLDSGRFLIGAYSGSRPWRLVIDTAGFVRDSRLGPELRVDGNRQLRPARGSSVHQMADRSTLWNTISSAQVSPQGFTPAGFRGIDGPRPESNTPDFSDYGGPWRYRRHNRWGYPSPHNRFRVLAVNQDGSILQIRDSLHGDFGNNVRNIPFLERVNTGTVPPGFAGNSPTDTAVRWSMPLSSIFRNQNLGSFNFIEAVVYQNEFDGLRPGGNPQGESAYLIGEAGNNLAVALVSGIGRRYDPLSSPPRLSGRGAAASVRAWPNPVRAGATLSLEPSGEAVFHPALIQLRDIQGRIVVSQRSMGRGPANLTLPAQLPAGVYVWQWSPQGGHQTPAHGRIVVTGG